MSRCETTYRIENGRNIIPAQIVYPRDSTKHTHIPKIQILRPSVQVPTYVVVIIVVLVFALTANVTNIIVSHIGIGHTELDLLLLKRKARLRRSTSPPYCVGAFHHMQFMNKTILIKFIQSLYIITKPIIY